MMPRPSFGFTAVAFCALTLVAPAFGQGGRGLPTPAPPTQMGPPVAGFNPAYASITVIVADADGADLSQQALVKISSAQNPTSIWGTTQDRSQIIFDSVPPADYEVEVSAAGYETTTKEVNVTAPGANFDVIVRLTRDGSGAVTNPIAGQLLAPKARKEVQKGIEALNSGNLNDAQKHLEAAFKLAPANADVDYLLGFLFLQKKDMAGAQDYLAKAISIDPHHARALITMGQLRIDQKDYPGAASVLEQAVTIDPGAWMGHWLLAEAYLETRSFDKAQEQADLAIEKGRTSAARAEIIKGEALAYLGQSDAARKALDAFIKQAPSDPLVPSVREMIAHLGETTTAPSYKEASTASEAALDSLRPTISASIGKRAENKLSIPLWRPPSVDDEKPVMASGVVCPSQQVIAGAGKRVTELVDNVGRIDATEDVLHEEVDQLGTPIVKQTRKFDYVVAISEVRGQRLMIDEHRSGMNGQSDFPGDIATHGLHGLAMVFHPLLRDDFQMTCEGLGDWHGQATWLIYFRQRADRPSRLMGYDFTDARYPIPLKGRAWVAAKTFQIVHLESDLVTPQPKIQLASQHQSVDYGMVHFAAKNTDLWLPKSAELYFDFRHHRYYRRHTFDSYKLFSVGATQKIGEPKEDVASQGAEKPER